MDFSFANKEYYFLSTDIYINFYLSVIIISSSLQYLSKVDNILTIKQNTKLPIDKKKYPLIAKDKSVEIAFENN